MKHLLIVDDSALARRILRRILEDAGHSLEDADSGSEALEKYFLRRPDLVFLDMNMPDLPGLEVIRKLKQMDPQARIIVATADVQSATEVQARAAGAAGYLTKPLTPAKVLPVLSEALAHAVQ